jgi:hypothetical protein
MNIEQSVVVYLRGARVFVAPEAGPGAVTYQIEPVIESSTDVAGLTAAIQEALANSKRTPGQPAPNLRSYKPPVLARAGVKSWSQFVRGLSQCSVGRGPSGYEVQAWRPSDEGFEPDGEPVRLPAGTSASQVAERVLECLRQ